MIAASLILFSCAPVLNRDLMKEGQRNASLDELRAHPEMYKGKLFILGGVIVDSRFTEEGSQIEVLSLPVDSYGYLKDSGKTMGRFLGIYPRDKGLLDPVVYKKGRNVTLAGVFVDARKGKVDDMEYVYPVFEVRQIYLWEETSYYAPYYYPPYYPYSIYPGPYWYHPYWGSWGPPPGWW